MKQRFGIKAQALLLALVLLCVCMPVAASEAPAEYTGTVLMALNTDRGDSYADFTTDRQYSDAAVNAADAPSEDKILPDGPLDDIEPLTAAQALVRQAQVGDVAPDAAAEYRVGDTKRIYSHYAVSEHKAYRRVDMVCTSVGDMVTVWRERGTEDDNAEFDEKLAAELDERLPQELEFFGDKRIDTDGDGKVAVFLYEIDGVNIGGYFTVVDLIDRLGRIGSVWNPSLSTSNHMDCIHVQGHSRYAFAVETCLHEYQHYIQASYRYVGHNNFNVLSAPEKYINEGFSTAAEFLLYGVDRYSDDFTWAARPSNGLSFMNWEHDNGDYSMAFVFSQYIRTRYAALTDDLDSEIPGGRIYKTILESRTSKNDDDTLAIIADLLYPAAAYPQLRDTEARCQQLLYDFWMAVFCQEPEGVHGFNGETWVNEINARSLVNQMPAGETVYPIRGGMAAFYQITDDRTDAVRITKSDKTLLFAVPPKQGYILRFDANGGTDAPYTQIMVKSYPLWDMPCRRGYSFMGWALTPDAVTARYNTGSTIRLTEDTTLYAVWKQAPVIETDTTYLLRRQSSEDRNQYRFTPPADGIYKLTTTRGFAAMFYADGEWIDPEWWTGGKDQERKYYFRLTGGCEYDLTVTAVGKWDAKGELCVTRQENYYTLTYRFDHPMLHDEWSYEGDVEYVADVMSPRRGPVFLGWAYAPDAQTPEVMPGDELTLTQDTTLYAVWAPDVPLPTDGSPAEAELIDGQRLYVLRPQQSGTYALAWTTGDDYSAEPGIYEIATLLDADGNTLQWTWPDNAMSCSLQAGRTYYLSVEAEMPQVVFTCRKTSDRITSSLKFDVGEQALFNLTLRGKTTYTIPNYTPAALDGRTFLGWIENNNWMEYMPGDTITVSGETVLTAQWSDEPDGTQAYRTAMAKMPLQVFRALWQSLFVVITNAFKK